MNSPAETLLDLCATSSRCDYICDYLDRAGVSYKRMSYPTGPVNIVVSFGDEWNWKNVYGAHYDVVDGAPGANDNGAAVVELLELCVKLTREGYSGPVAIVFFDLEEPGNRLFGTEAGSFEFGDELSRRGCRPELFVVLDVSGTGNLLYYDKSGDRDMAAQVSDVVGYALPSRYTPGSDDLHLGRSGIDSVLLCTLPEDEFQRGSPDTWCVLHTKDDSPEKIDIETIQYVSDVLYALSCRAAGRKAPTVDPICEIDSLEGRVEDGLYGDFWDYEDDWDDWGLEDDEFIGDDELCTVCGKAGRCRCRKDLRK